VKGKDCCIRGGEQQKRQWQDEEGFEPPYGRVDSGGEPMMVLVVFHDPSPLGKIIT
jgi:hypothetical protein